MHIIHTMKSADLIRELTEAGWTIDRVRGSHHVFRSRERPGHMTVPHPKKGPRQGPGQGHPKAGGVGEMNMRYPIAI